jgi:uncharacterized protein
MSDAPAKPLVEYPTDYAFKVMGKRDEDFTEYIRVKFTQLLGAEVGREAIAENVSKQGRYISVTVTVRLHTEEQRQKIYADIHTDTRIVYYL